MAILMRGTTTCQICGKVIEEGEDAMLFPHFVMNECDELYPFSDSACHSACLRNLPLGGALGAASEAYLSRTGPGRRRCVVCGNETLDPDDYLLIGYLGAPAEGPLQDFNFTHLHKSHIPSWAEADRFRSLATEALASGRWKGPQLPDLIQVIDAARRSQGKEKS
jgi:predicted nucleic acid-binding Zn ribbon protein